MAVWGGAINGRGLERVCIKAKMREKVVGGLRPQKIVAGQY